MLAFWLKATLRPDVFVSLGALSAVGTPEGASELPGSAALDERTRGAARSTAAAGALELPLLPPQPASKLNGQHGHAGERRDLLEVHEPSIGCVPARAAGALIGVTSMTITGTGGTGCDDRSKPPEFRSPPASLIKVTMLLDAPSSVIAGDTDDVWCARGKLARLPRGVAASAGVGPRHHVSVRGTDPGGTVVNRADRGQGPPFFTRTLATAALVDPEVVRVLRPGTGPPAKIMPDSGRSYSPGEVDPELAADLVHGFHDPHRGGGRVQRRLGGSRGQAARRFGGLVAQALVGDVAAGVVAVDQLPSRSWSRDRRSGR